MGGTKISQLVDELPRAETGEKIHTAMTARTNYGPVKSIRKAVSIMIGLLTGYYSLNRHMITLDWQKRLFEDSVMRKKKPQNTYCAIARAGVV